MIGVHLYILNQMNADNIKMLKVIENNINAINQYFIIDIKLLFNSDLRDNETIKVLNHLGIKYFPSIKFFNISTSHINNLTINGYDNILRTLISNQLAIINTLNSETKQSNSTQCYGMANDEEAILSVEEYQRNNLYEEDSEGNIVTSRLDTEDDPERTSNYLKNIAKSSTCKPVIDENLHQQIRQIIRDNPKQYKKRMDITPTQKKLIRAGKESGINVEKIRYGNNNPHSNPGDGIQSFPARHELERDKSMTEDKRLNEDHEVSRNNTNYDNQIINSYMYNPNSSQNNDYENMMASMLNTKK